MYYRDHLINQRSLIKLFEGWQEHGYQNITKLTDTKIGFSIQKHYPAHIEFKPVKLKNGEDDDVAVIWVIYDEQFRKPDESLVPIRFRIAKLSRYRITNYEYDFNATDCPSKESVHQSENSPQPFEINVVRNYFYNTSKGYFVTKSGNQILGLEILNEIFQRHCDSSHPIKGIGVRVKNWFFGFLFRFLENAVNFVIIVLNYIFGRRLEEQPNRSVYFHGYLYSDFKRNELDFIELSGYRSSKSVILVFCLIIAITSYFVLPAEDNSYIGNLINSDFLIIVHGLLVLFFLDNILPLMCFKLLNSIIKVRKNLFNYLMRNRYL